jgi:GT2 family glycosyltransferase
MKNGEDIDLTFRLWKAGFETQLIKKAFVYHKRRTSLNQFFKQTFGFGTARPLLNKKYPATAKLTYWFPSLFIAGLLLSSLISLLGYHLFFKLYIIYLFGIFFDSLFANGIQVATLSVITSLTQFFGYGLGFLKAQFFKRK